MCTHVSLAGQRAELEMWSFHQHLRSIPLNGLTAQHSYRVPWCSLFPHDFF